MLNYLIRNIIPFTSPQVKYIFNRDLNDWSWLNYDVGCSGSINWHHKVHLFRAIVSHFLANSVNGNHRIRSINDHGDGFVVKIYGSIVSCHIFVVKHSSVSAKHPSLCSIARKSIVLHFWSSKPNPSIAGNCQLETFCSSYELFASYWRPIRIVAIEIIRRGLFPDSLATIFLNIVIFFRKYQIKEFWVFI